MKVYNSLTFEKEEFIPLVSKKIKMYVCGPTVYDSAHLGHAKAAVVFDVMRRYFKFNGFEVEYVTNYTDIDDKIIKRANELNINYKELSEKYIKEYEEISKALNILPPTHTPRATEVIPFMLDFIEELIKKDHAYERNGSVYFSVKSFPKYNTIMQNIKEDEDQEEEEEEYLADQDTAFGEDKLDLKDFALWKKMKEGEPYWESPWGKGRPGWHIECSAMVLNLLGETIDIHGGGQDLKFPHHRNEIAQSESYTGKPFSKYFMHNGFINVNDEKMSKSLKNSFIVTDILKQYDPMVVRWYLIKSHYRSSINYLPDNLEQSEVEYNRLLNTIKKVYQADPEEIESKDMEILIKKLKSSFDTIISAMEDDFDTPIAIAEILTLFREINKVIIEEEKTINKEFKSQFMHFIEKLESIFGVFPNIEEKVLGISSGTTEKDTLIKQLVDLLTEVRNDLRSKKMYELSDRIRDQLRELGIDVEDKKLK
jgi:cysteinyl-tRNA synthetase